MAHQPIRPAPRFFKYDSQLERIKDSLRLCHEAERIAREYAERRWGKEGA